MLPTSWIHSLKKNSPPPPKNRRIPEITAGIFQSDIVLWYIHLIPAHWPQALVQHRYFFEGPNLGKTMKQLFSTLYSANWYCYANPSYWILRKNSSYIFSQIFSLSKDSIFLETFEEICQKYITEAGDKMSTRTVLRLGSLSVILFFCYLSFLTDDVEGKDFFIALFYSLLL